MDRKLILSATARYLPTIIGSQVFALGFCMIGGAITGFGAKEGLFYIGAPCMSGGSAGAITTLPSLYSALSGQDMTGMAGQFLCYASIANILAVLMAAVGGAVTAKMSGWNGGGRILVSQSADEVARLIRELDTAITSAGLSIDILPGESGDYEYLYKFKNDAAHSNVLSAFFTPGTSTYIGNLTHVKKLICGHSYWTDGTWDGMRNVRKQLAQAAQQYDVEIWQSEWSMLGDGYSSSEFIGYDQATEMDIALYMSKVIHNDLTIAGVSSWSYFIISNFCRMSSHCPVIQWLR